jgi:poly(A) polymerase Pap1
MDIPDVLKGLQRILNQENSVWAQEWSDLLKDIEWKLRRAKMIVEMAHQQPFQDLSTTWDARKILMRLQMPETKERDLISRVWDPTKYRRRF